MDEPLGALDAMTRDHLHDEIERVAAELTVLFVTHNMREAVRLADRGGADGARTDRPRAVRRAAQPRGSPDLAEVAWAQDLTNLRGRDGACVMTTVLTPVVDVPAAAPPGSGAIDGCGPGPGPSCSRSAWCWRRGS